MNNQNYYQQQIPIHQEKLKIAKANYRTFSLLRLLAFLGIVFATYFFWGSWLFLVSDVVLIGGFILLVNKSLDAKLAKEKEELFIALNQAELKALQGDWSSFADGNEYKIPNHPYALDMDLFGPKSIYQLINRTALKSGSDLLAKCLEQGSENYVLNNLAINEFSENIKWCQDFVVEGQVRVKDIHQQKSIKFLKNFIIDTRLTNVLKWLLPTISIAAVVFYNLGMISMNVMSMSLVTSFLIISGFLKSSNKLINAAGSVEKETQVMIQQLELLKKLPLQHPNLIEEINKLSSGNSILHELKELQAIQKRMDYRANFLVGTLLNIFAAWDFVVVGQFKKWHLKNVNQLEFWEEQIAQLEVWVSGAIYKFNHPNSVDAQFTDNGTFKIDDLGHPFVVQGKQVRNDVSISPNENFLIITGPNMAGKSTYLRSVGFAIISANAGFPVLAKKCELPKLELYSSMRTTDDLTVESSYFHAELTRLRFIMDAIESGKQTFVILDEILKGTNSKDKEIGSAKFLQKLHRLKTKGIIATHDLSLTNLSTENPSFRNVYFDSTIEQENLYFDYKVREGVCQNMNASFLLKQMKLVD